jgi:hypothetical protein
MWDERRLGSWRRAERLMPGVSRRGAAGPSGSLRMPIMAVRNEAERPWA